ncbi:MAG: PKD domain-containing protein [Gaiellaceae bacterium]
MTALKTIRRKALRPRWLVLLALAAATIPAALLAATTASSAPQIPVSDPAHPVIDARWIYAHDWFDANNFIYKVAGSDGCLPSATTCGTGTQTDPSNNLPENYNGAQEFYSWWKDLGTTHTPQPNGDLGKWITARDHLFPTRTWQLDDAELTLPGATCAGQQVMLASHNDSTPVNAVSPGTSATPMSGMHSGNWGNGSAYDANMGENMNIEEIGSILRWHEVNGTYPARTIKATLYDNEEGGLVGSGDYSAAGTAAAIVAAPTAVGDTNIKVTSTSNLGAGTVIALDEVNTENPTVASVGTAATNTSLVGPNSAGDTLINVASVSGITAGQTLKIDLGNVDTSTAATVGTAQRTATTLAAAAAAGDTNIKVASVTNMVAGERIALDVGFSNVEYDKITAVGTAGSGGTGVTLQTALAGAHANGASAQDLGSGITLTTPLSFAHPTGAHVIDASALGTGITLTAPLAQAHAFGSTVNGSATGLMSDSPQGQIIGVFNNDQDGLNYPAPKWGTDHYLNDLVNGGIGPWFNNINATPVSAAPNSIYGAVGIQRLQHNLPAVTAFRQASADAVTKALQDLGQKYNFSIPLENPLVFKNTGSVPDNPVVQTRPAYMPADQAQYTPVLDDLTGRTDQVSFGVRGIPSLGDIGQYDSNTTPLVGGNENPYPTAYPSKPTLAGMYGQDSTSDYFSNLNFWASGTVHGPGGYDQPSEGLLRGVEFIATWFSYAIASPQEGGAVAKPVRPIAYFEMTPKKPTAQTTVSFDAGYSRTKSGDTSGLTYYWDFGDGSPMVMTTNPIIQHTFPTQAAWRDVKLLVGGAGSWNDPSKWGSFRQLEPIDFFPTYYPALVPPTEPQAPTTGSAANPCGALTADEQTALIAEAKDAKYAGGPQPTLRDLASVSLRKH